jgi:AraC-like DNA-binding protein
MAAESYECNIITGGYNHCDSSWNKQSDELDRCFKIYHPVGGEAILTIDGTEYPVTSGNIYYISGFNLEAQKCTSYMDVYWLHFIPSSLYLRHILLRSAPVYVWQKDKFPFMDEFNGYVKSLFRSMSLHTPDLSVLPHSYEEAKLQSYILNFVADILRTARTGGSPATAEIVRIKPSVDFMNKEFRKNPPLEEVAQKSSLAPNYFHRIFRKNFGTTPLNYMLRLRMETAIRLLTTTSKTIKEIAHEAGYDNEFYFYRQFKKQYNYSPGRLKKIRPF